MSSMALILGAGFLKAAGSPLAAELFDIEPFGGAQWRNRLIDRVLVAWDRWSQEHDGGPEAFVTEVYRHRNEFSGWLKISHGGTSMTPGPAVRVITSLKLGYPSHTSCGGTYCSKGLG
jgi:hypothetical protein